MDANDTAVPRDSPAPGSYRNADTADAPFEPGDFEPGDFMEVIEKLPRRVRRAGDGRLMSDTVTVGSRLP